MNEKNQHLNDIFRKAANQIGSSPDQLQRAAQTNPKLADALKNLSSEDINKINAIINDKEATARILATPQAQEILKRLKKKP